MIDGPLNQCYAKGGCHGDRPALVREQRGGCIGGEQRGHTGAGLSGGRRGWGGVTIINGSPAMLMVRRTIGFILRHMLPMAAQTGPVSAGAPLFGLAHNHHGTHASQGHGCMCVCVCVRQRTQESL